MRRSASRVLLLASPAAALVLSLVACSGTAAPGIGSGGDVDAGAADGSTAKPDGATASDGGVPAAEAGADTGVGVDAGLVVTEEPAPQCNDLAQQAPLVMPSGDPGNAPSPLPGVVITPGLYVASAIVDYGGDSPVQSTSTRTTVFFTATKQYYVRDDALGAHQQLTLDWKITGGKLVRTVLCSQNSGATTVSYAIGAAPNGGFVIFIDNVQPGRTETVRYDRVP